MGGGAYIGGPRGAIDRLWWIKARGRTVKASSALTLENVMHFQEVEVAGKCRYLAGGNEKRPASLPVQGA